MEINWNEQKQIERKIYWVTIKETNYHKQIPKTRKNFEGVDFDDAFNKLYDYSLYYDDNFQDNENGLWKINKEDESYELVATNEQIFEYLLDSRYEIYIEDTETDVTFNAKHCNVDWKNNTFYINELTNEIIEDIEDYFENN